MEWWKGDTADVEMGVKQVIVLRSQCMMCVSTQGFNHRHSLSWRGMRGAAAMSAGAALGLRDSWSARQASPSWCCGRPADIVVEGRGRGAACRSPSTGAAARPSAPAEPNGAATVRAQARSSNRDPPPITTATPSPADARAMEHVPRPTRSICRAAVVRAPSPDDGPRRLNPGHGPAATAPGPAPRPCSMPCKRRARRQNAQRRPTN